MSDFMFLSVPKCHWSQERAHKLGKSLLDRPASFLLKMAEQNGRDLEIGEIDVVINNCLAAFEGIHNQPERRDMSVVQFEGMEFPYFITGGMSYGDSPTAAFDDMQWLLSMPSATYGLLIEWAQYDAC